MNSTLATGQRALSFAIYFSATLNILCWLTGSHFQKKKMGMLDQKKTYTKVPWGKGTSYVTYYTPVYLEMVVEQNEMVR